VSWYDWFANFYDRSLEPLYRDARRAAAEALRVAPDHTILDLPCGTGQSFDVLAPRGALLIGADLSAGMLRRARQRVVRHGWPHVQLLQRDVHAITRADVVSGLIERVG
jgi:cyclopropane fatty-acyl-phospholipid synthase-like methyltransferase